MTPSLRVLLVDDERPARKWLRQLLSSWPEIEIVGEAGGVGPAAELARREKPDVIFLDVQMPPGNGFDLLPQLRPLPQIVFVTAHDSFAVRAFEAHALDYLLKPVHPERLAETMRRLREPFPATPSRAGQIQGRLQPDDLLPLRDRGILRMASVGEIAAIQAEGAYSRVWLREEESMLIWRRIREWEDLLPMPPFVRIHRSLMINLDRVQSVQSKSRDEASLSLSDIPTPLLIGRSASLRLRKLLHK